MMMKVFTVRDLKSCVYLRPVFNLNAGAAIRDFGDEVSGNEKSMLHAHPEDFQLFEIGEFDDQSGELKPTFPVKYLAQGTDFASPRRVRTEWQPDGFVKEMVTTENGGSR